MILARPVVVESVFDAVGQNFVKVLCKCVLQSAMKRHRVTCYNESQGKVNGFHNLENWFGKYF